MRKHYPLNSNGAEDAGKLPWTDGVPSTGVEGSYPGQALFTDTEAEVLAAIDASGQTRNGSDLTQLVQAFARGIYLGQFSGTANALAVAIPNNVVFATLLRGIRFTGFVSATNTAGVTVAITGIGPVTTPATVTAPLLRKNGTALQAGDLPVAQDFEIRWDGSAFRMVGAVASDGGGSGSGSTTQSGAWAAFAPIKITVDTQYANYTLPGGYLAYRFGVLATPQTGSIDMRVALADTSTFLGGASDYTIGYAGFAGGTILSQSTPSVAYPVMNGVEINDHALNLVARSEILFLPGTSTTKAQNFCRSSGVRTANGFVDSLAQSFCATPGQAKAVQFLAYYAPYLIRAGTIITVEGLNP